MSSSDSPLWAQGAMQKKRQKCERQRGRMTPRKQCLETTTGLRQVWTQTLWKRSQGLHRFTLDSAERRERKWVPIPNQEATCNWYLLAKEKKFSLLEWSLAVYINHTSGQVQCPAVVDQHKTCNDVFVGFYSFYLFGLLLVYFGFCVCVCFLFLFFSICLWFV